MSTNPIRLATRRRHVLDYLRDGPADKRSITDALAISRSTADRAVRELHDAGLVREVDGQYETTLTGVLALERSRAVDRDGNTLAATERFLTPLWKETPLALPFLREAVGEHVGGSDVGQPLARLRTVLESATELRALLPTVPSGDHLDQLKRVVDRESHSVDVVCADSLFDRLARDRRQLLHEVTTAANATVSTGSVPEFGLYQVDIGDESHVFVVVYDDGVAYAVLRNDTAAAVSWAEQCIADHAGRATAVEDRVQALVEEPTSLRGSPVDGGSRAMSTDPAPDADDEPLLGAGYAIDGSRLRTPEFGAEGECTVLFWMLPTRFDGWEVLVKWDYLAIGHRRGLLYGWIFDPADDRRRARVDLPVDQLDLTTWTHVGYTYDEASARLYIDGELVAETEDDYPLSIDSIGACLGYIYEDRDTGVHDPTYSGRLVGARFYDQALSADSIERLYRVTAPG